MVAYNFIPHTRHRGPQVLLDPQALDAFGLKPSNQLVIGYHWLVVLIQIHKSL